MNFIRRAGFYIMRKKGKTFSLFLLTAIVSTFFISCFSVLNAAEMLTAEIRRSIGAAFYVRAGASVNTDDNGRFSLVQNSIHITDEDIAKIMQCGDISYCNPMNYGYAKSNEITFVPGEQDNQDNNMGQVTALCYSALHTDFTDGTIFLSAGGHITGTSRATIIISSEVAAKNNLSVGDTVTLVSAGLGTDAGSYTDSWQGDRGESRVTIAGIYDILKEHTSAAETATAGKQENRIYASHDVLNALKESEPSVYTGEVGFYVTDPAELTKMLSKIHQITSIDWKTHFIRTNDFQYSKISDSMLSFSNLVKVLLACVAVVSAIILTLILALGMRSRIRETGIFLAVGISKEEILLQFLSEALTVTITAFVFSCAVWPLIRENLANRIFADFRPELMVSVALENGKDASLKRSSYFNPGVWKTFIIYGCQLITVTASVFLSAVPILRLKPKEIFTKMS